MLVWLSVSDQESFFYFKSFINATCSHYSFIHWAYFQSIYLKADSVLATEKDTEENEIDSKLKKSLH